jgi:magnesium chelatase subunit H
MHLSRMGKYVANTQTGGRSVWLKKLRPWQDAQGKNKPASAGAKQMAMLRRLPKLLRFIPGLSARYSYLLLGDAVPGQLALKTIFNLVIMLVQRYARIQETHGCTRREVASPG